MVGLAVGATACQTDLTALNQNPNNPTSAPANPLFTNATESTIRTFNGSFNTLSMTALWAQHIAQVQYVDEDRGHIRPTTVDALFSGQYIGPLEDLQKVIVGADSAKLANTSGPAKVMQSWIFQNMTDLWGDIPYSEALAGDIGGPSKPKYDPQKDIYYGMLKTLTDATNAMKGGLTVNDGGLGSADPIYKGDVTKWVKFSNSLRARMAMRISKADPAKSAAELAAAFAAPGGLITSNADNAKLAYPGDGVYDNPWAANFAGRDDHRMSKTIMDTLIALNDPRLPIYAQPTKADPTKYAGLQNGLDNNTAAPFFNTTSRPGAIFYPGATVYGTFGTSAGKQTPNYLVTAAEVAFIQAEAAEKGIGGLPGTAASYYNAGVTLSITQWGATAAQAATYLAQPGVAYAGGATGLKQIGLQKWLSMFSQPNEAWSEWRRTGNPASIHAGPEMYPDVPDVPRRLVYSGAEQSVNAASLADAIARQGPDLYSTRVWWDK
jgi:hypothetical protein